MKIFLTGATGYIGFAVAGSLLQAGHKVFGLARSAAAATKLRSVGVEVVEGDLTNPESLARGAAGCDGVIHTAMSWGPEAGTLEAQAVRTILAALQGSARPFLYTSGVWVVGDTKGKVVGEMAVLRPPPLVAWRPAVERLALDGDGKVQGMVVRPAVVFGRAGGLVAGFVQQARRDRVIRIPGNGDNHWSFVHIDALADLYRRMIEQAPRGEIFFAADGPAITLRTVVETVAAMDDARVEALPIEEARKTMGPLADALALDQKIMSTKAGRILGWGPKTSTVLEEIRSGYEPES